MKREIRMNNVILSKIYLDNYKLFDDFTLDFSDGLNVFDGPNGYGKTSLFDAIEFLITGDIKRVTSCEVIDGKNKFEKVFFARDAHRDVIIKAEFSKGVETFTIVKKVDGKEENISTVDNNPKKLGEITKTYVIPSFDYVEYADEYLVALGEVEKMQSDLFGDISQVLYSLLFYTQQEDRLDYFKNNELNRMGNINSLFHIEGEREKFEQIKRAKKRVGDLIKHLDAEISRLQGSLSNDMQYIPGAQIAYKKLLKKDFLWDVEDAVISSKESLDKILQILKQISELCSVRENYKHDLLNQRYEKFLNNASLEKQLKSYIMKVHIGDNTQEYSKNKEIYLFLKGEVHKMKELKFIDVEYKQLGVYLNKTEICEIITQKVTEYRTIEKNVQDTQKSIGELLRIREQLTEKLDSEDILQEGKCPYCGYEWTEKQTLVENIDKTTKDVNALLGTTAKQMEEIFDTIKEMFQESLFADVNLKISSFEENLLLIEYINYDEKEMVEKAKFVDDFFTLNNLDIKVTQEFSIGNMEHDIASIQSNVKEKEIVLTEDYYQKKAENSFDNIVKEYFENLNEIAEISQVEIVEKEQYLKYRFSLLEMEKEEKIERLKGKKDCIDKEINKKLAQYMKDWKLSIDRYQGNIITQIEIPFYIYSARILQSYQGGQGILIRDKDGKEELNSIRFTTPNDEHDVLYTMSSGQLSGILLAFSLALHKIFVNEGLNVLFIDDPVQCMDDLNIVSFVELMKIEFPDVQLLISTHENSFAGYVLYKYDKSNLPHKRFSLKELRKN
jgi:exonuclease SbcC